VSTAPPEQEAQRVFGRRARMYTNSATHTDAELLRRVVDLAHRELNWRALDVGTGTGHTALAVAAHGTVGTPVLDTCQPSRVRLPAY